MKKSVLRKVMAVALSATVLCGTGFTTVGQFVGTDVSVSATEVYGDFEYEANNNNTITITNYKGNGGDVTIPSTIDGKSVTSIGSWAFEYCTGLTSINIPNSVTEIGYGAFENCTGLTSVVIPNSVTEIGSTAFGYYSYGFSSNGINYITVKKINNFTIYGAKGSVAETYANEWDIPFVSEYSNISTISSDEIILFTKLPDKDSYEL